MPTPPSLEITPIDAGDAATGLVALGLFWLWVGLLWVLTARKRRAKTVGTVLVREPGDARQTFLLVSSALAALVIGILVPHGPKGQVLGLAVGLALALGVYSPRAGEASAGREGISFGWEAWPWGAVSRWRLLGEHLRVEVAGRWLALRVDSKELQILEELLEERLPGRRSPLM